MSTGRYPFSSYPTGWYLALESAAVAPGAVVPLRLFGRELVAFRTEAGVAAIVDAHCPHLGAHVGYGGVVEGEGIRCPFHKWRFGVDGLCDDVPYTTEHRPPRVGLGTYPVHEVSGLVLVHFSEAGNEPTWWVPDVPEWGEDGWVGYETRTWRVRMHVQELIENAPDMPHFTYVHRLGGNPAAECSFDGHIYRQRSYYADTDETFTSQTAYGLGLIWLRSENFVMLAAIAPVDEEYSEIRLNYLYNEGPGATQLTPKTLALLDAVSAQTDADVPIWEHKVYREKPPYVAGDGPIRLVRQWARQFYETSAEVAEESTSEVSTPVTVRT